LIVGAALRLGRRTIRGGGGQRRRPLTRSKSSRHCGSIEEIDARISAVRRICASWIEQAATYSGAADEELSSQRIAEQEAQLDILTERRAVLLQQR